MAFQSTYQRPGFTCLGGTQPGLANLAKAILGDPLPPVPRDRKAGSIRYGRWPESFNLGTYNCRRVAGSLSLRKSAHAEGRALDVGFLVGDPKGHPSGWALAYRLVAAKDDIGLSYLVWAGQSWRAGRGWRTFTGSNKHFDHVHFEITHQAADQLSAAEAKAAVGPPNTGRFLMALTDDEQERLLANTDRLLAILDDTNHPAPLNKGSVAWMIRDWNDMFRQADRGVVAKVRAVDPRAVIDELLSRFRQ